MEEYVTSETRKMILVATLCGFGYMMYSLDRMTLTSTLSLIADEFGLSKTISGVLLSSFFYGFIAFLFVSGIVSDKLTGKPVLICGLLIFSVATMLTGAAGGLAMMLVYRVITGIGEGLFWPAASLEVANVTSEKQRTTVMSLYWAGYPIGGFLGTWLGAIVGPTYGWRMVFYVAGLLGVLVAILYAVLVKGGARSQGNAQKIRGSEKVSFKAVIGNSAILSMALYYFGLLSGWWVVLMWAPTFLMKVKHLPIETAGTIASLLGVAGALGGFTLGRYCDKVSFEKKRIALVVVTLLSAVAMAALVLNLSTVAVVVVILLLGFLGYPVTPMVLSFTSELIDARHRGAALGFVTNVGMAAGGVSPALAGYFAQQHSMESVWVVAACVMGASSLLLWRVSRVAMIAPEAVTSAG